MRLPRIAKEGLQALGINKLRTFFMMAGTIVGVAALVVIMALGNGTEKKVSKRMQNFGPRAMMLIAGGGKDLPPPDMTVTTLTLEDAEAVRNEIGGLEVIHRLRPEFPDLPILVLTMHEEQQYAVRVIEAGAMGYLPKTVDADDILSAIRHLMAGDTYFPPAIAA